MLAPSQALEEKASGTARLESRIKALESERDSLKADRDSLAMRFEAALKAQEGDKGSRDRELEAARGSAEAAVGSLREAQGEVNRLRGVLRSMEEEASARSNQLAQLAATLADTQAEMAGLRGEYGDKLLLSTQVAHLQLDNGRLLALLRRTREYATMAGQLFPAARAARVLAAVGAAGGGGDAEEAAADVAPGYRLRSTYLGSLPQGLPGSYSYLGGVPPGAHPPPSNGRLLDMVPNGDRKWDALNGLEDSYGDYADRVAVGMEAERGMAAAAFTNGLTPYPPPGEGELFDRALEAQRWVPSDAVALSSAFRQRYLNHVNHEDVRAFLIGLQLIWAARCEEEIAASRAALLKKIKELKRSIAQRMPYREVMQASTIARINQELTGMRYKMGLSGGVSGPAVPQSDHDAHAVAFGRTASIEGGGNGSGNGRSTSPVRAFLQSVTRFGALGGAAAGSSSGSGSGSGSFGVSRMEGEGGYEGGYEGGVRNTAMLSTALREAASRLRATTFPAPPSAAKNPGAPQLAVTLQRVPGSGARRLDAIEAAQLLEAALAAVDELSHANAALKTACESQEAALREAAGEAEEEMNLRRATAAVAERERALALSRVGGKGGGGGASSAAAAAASYRNPGLPESYSTSQQLPYAALGGFAGTVTAQLASKAGLAYPPPEPLAPPGAGPGNHYPTASGSGSNSYSVPFGGSGAFPPPFAHSPQHHHHQHQQHQQHQQQQQQSYGGGSGVGRSPFPGSQGPIRASHTSTHFNAFPPPQQAAYPPPPQTYHAGGSGDQLSSSTTPTRQRRLSVSDAVKAALGAVLQSVAVP